MALNKKFSDSDYARFEADLLYVLKKDPSHRLDFDGKLLIKSRRLDCLLAATDVFWDEKSGDIVLVGAFRSGTPVYDPTKAYPVMQERVSVPLRECFEDLKVSSGNEMRLLGKARKAVIDRYVGTHLSYLASKKMMQEGILDLKALNLHGFDVGQAGVNAVLRGEEGDITLICGNSLNASFDNPLSRIPLQTIQAFGSHLERVREMYGSASEIFTRKMEELEPRSMSFSAAEQRLHRDAALMAVFDSGAPLDVCSAIAYMYADSDVFDRHTRKMREIEASVACFRSTGWLETRRRNGPSL